MAKNIIVINVDLRETRVALIQDGVIAELHIERTAHRGTVGNVVLGKVTRVLPGMQAAFIDVGQDRAAFLHVEDLIRPKDFDAYLAANSKALALATGEVVAESEDDKKESVAAAPQVGAAEEGEDAERGRGRRRRRSRRGRGGKRVGAADGAAADLESDGALLAGDEGRVEDDESELEEEGASEEAGLDDELAEYDGESEADGALDLTALLDLDEDDIAQARRGGAAKGSRGGAESADRKHAADARSQDGSDEDEDDDRSDEDEDRSDEDDDRSDEDDDRSDEDDDRSDEDDDRSDEDEDDDRSDDEDDDRSDDEDDDRADDEDEDRADDEDDDRADDEDEDRADDEDDDRADDEDDDRSDDEDASDEDAADDDEDEGSSDDEDEDPSEGPSEPGDASADVTGAAKTEAGTSRRRRAPRAAGDAAAAAESAEAAPSGDAAAGEEEPAARYRRRRRRRGRGGAAAPRAEAEASPTAQAPEAAAGVADDGAGDDEARKARRRRGRRGRRGPGEADAARPRAEAKPAAAIDPTKVPARVSRSVPITEVVREGDEVVVQISKEPIGTKGARVTSHVSLPGRYVVYLPTVEHTGISKRIGQGRERSRLRKVIDALKPPTGGLIVRTVAEGLTKKQLKADVGYLIRVWADIAEKRKSSRARDVLYEELDLVLKVARDYFTDEVVEVIIDDRDQYARLVRFVEMFMPGRAGDIKLYTGDEPIFDAYGIEDEIKRALSRKVPLPSGGSLIMDQAEALTAIDVNTGRYVGKGSKDLEETALKTNLEAVDEIAQQLRFRNIGGLVILDLIDMERAENRDKVWRALEKCLAKDKAKTTINRISELGLIEMTRKRTRESLGRIMHESCFYCDGTGHIQSRETIAYEILRQIRRERHTLPGYSVRVCAHPAVVDFLKFDAKDAVVEAERRYLRRIELVPKQEYHIEQYDLQGR